VKASRTQRLKTWAQKVHNSAEFHFGCRVGCSSAQPGCEWGDGRVLNSNASLDGARQNDEHV
jgi:hypothetical protein